MALRHKVVLHAVGYTLVVLALIAFSLRLILKVNSGQALETYRSGTQVQWSYGGALAALVALGVAVVVALAVRGFVWLRARREIRRLSYAHGKLGPKQGQP